MNHFYYRSLHAACAVDTSVGGAYDFLSNFLMNLMLSRRAPEGGHQIHYLHLALVDLDCFEKELHVANANEEIIRLFRVQDQIRSIKIEILEYLRFLTAQQPVGIPVNISSG